MADGAWFILGYVAGLLSFLLTAIWLAKTKNDLDKQRAEREAATVRNQRQAAEIRAEGLDPKMRAAIQQAIDDGTLKVGR